MTVCQGDGLGVSPREGPTKKGGGGGVGRENSGDGVG